MSRTILIGPPGTGKTSSIISRIETYSGGRWSAGSAGLCFNVLTPVRDHAGAGGG